MLESDPGVNHIPASDDSDWYTPDEHLQWLVRRSVGEAVWPVAESALQDLGRLVPQKIEQLARDADRNPPVLRQYDARGARIDEIDFHPAYNELERTVLGTGVVQAAHLPGWRGLSAPAPRALISAMSYLLTQSDQAITGCPIGMMDAMARCLTRNDTALAERYVPRIADAGGNHLRSAMFLTEKAGGSDVGANEAVAAPAPDGTWRLRGEKWFASCPQSDLILVMARPEGAQSGPKGLGLFLMPRLLDDGTRNSFVIHRLKDKFGTRAMASGEVGLRDAVAWQVGDIDRGMRQMMDMVSLTRVGIAAATAGAMRRNTFEALTHTHGRRAFGAVLDRQPMMRDSLADLVVESTAALTAAIGVAETLDAADSGNTEAQAALRLLTPLYKLYGTERARIVATDAMEIRGGNGFIEDWPEPRILRDVYVHAIWEGSGNVIALDVARALRSGAGAGFLEDIERRAETVSAGGPVAPLAGILLDELRAVDTDLSRLVTAEPDRQQVPLRRIARRMAVLATGSRLAEQANEFAAEMGSGRLAWIAARYLTRLASQAVADEVASDTSWFAHADELLHGGPVPVESGADLARLVAAIWPQRPAPVDALAR
jgi:alkylation response protein AidB-like acyl-CoA dehydrogenase